MNKFLSFLIISLLTLTACDNKETVTNEKPTVKIGAILPLTGGMANLGLAGLNGATLAIEEANKNPSVKNHYKLISDDTATDAKKAIPIYKKMFELDKVSSFVSFDSQSGHVIKPLAAKDKIIHISSAADPTVADGKYNFINSSDLYDGVDKLLKYFKKMNFKKISVASTNHMAAQKVLEIMEEKISDYDMEIVSQQLVNPAERQIKAEVNKIIQSSPDVIFLYGFEPLTSLFAKELKLSGNTKPISSIYTFSYSEHKELFNGNIYLDYGSGDNDFIQRYTGRFGIKPNPASAVVYDSVNILIQKHEHPEKDIKNILWLYDGVNGKLKLKDNGLIHANLIFVKMTNGEPVLVEK